MFRLPSWDLTCSVTSSGTSGARHPQLMQKAFSLSAGESNTSAPHLGQALKSIVLCCPPVIHTKRTGRTRPPAHRTVTIPRRRGHPEESAINKPARRANRSPWYATVAPSDRLEDVEPAGS